MTNAPAEDPITTPLAATSKGPAAVIPTLDRSVAAQLAALADSAGIRSVHLLAWRDLEDPASGGSEVHASIICGLWAQAGIDVTMRTCEATGKPRARVRDGYSVIRAGSRFGVFPRAAVAEMRGLHGHADALVEIWNGMPFASPIWWPKRKPHNVWIHHVHGAMWTMMLGKIGHLGILLEERIAPIFYRKTPIVTLSQSSKDELVSLKFPAANITIVPPGINPHFTPGGTKSPEPLLVAVGRLAPVKRVHLVIEAMIRVRQHVPGARLVIVGEGGRRGALSEQIAAAGAQDYITLAGHVSEQELIELYRSAWVVTSGSEREGWGMTLTEAAACGTPSVVTNISGHCDAVVDGVSGLLADVDTTSGIDLDPLVDKLITVLTDDALREDLAGGALRRADEFSWSHTALETFRSLAASASRR